jgi:hypothetical protein
MRARAPRHGYRSRTDGNHFGFVAPERRAAEPARAPADETSTPPATKHRRREGEGNA